ncbi:MAG: hypothetical protein ILO34_02340 [Kiritimatiellae bacterium]|nr:hypothetical protein [Kiritimatiellia bacterium]
MNKALHALVYVFLALAGAGLWFELELNGKRELLTDRNRLQENYFVKLAGTVEKDDPAKDVTVALELDVSPVEAKIVDTPETENLLEDYNASLEQQNLATYDWNNQSSREQLRTVYVLGFDGKPVMDGNRPLMSGDGTEDKLLSTLFESAKSQQAKLNSTRAELVKLRGKFEEVVAAFNKLKPEARQDKVTIVEKNAKIEKLEDEKSDLENQIVKIKAQIDELNAEITSLKDEVITAKDETEAAKEDLEKSQKMVEQLKKLMREMVATTGGGETARGTAVTSLPAGDKGKIIEVDNDNMFAVVAFSDEAMKELKGDNLDHPLPAIELGVKRPGYNGDAGEFVGRLRLRQEVKGKNYVIADILSSWEQAELQLNDVVFAD